MMVSNAPARVNEVLRGPVAIVERTPDRVIVVDHDRVRDLQTLQGSTDIVDVVLECELGCVHAEHDEFPTGLSLPKRGCTEACEAS